ncbi:MAG TPA: CO dehydrogenase/acetyl-CoA synthase subunit delta [Firmicutes bacterium]|jgi:acetyl-CoA decarbonylase/synthase complex subunit delta|nr:acetyl-CoA decarbonylase/synthase complex subunit delta [Bacillota bacterium]HAA33944.1 CO dehydrogenase/acetyl-CoA synthase subunit delta [Bacillota bacterium]
MAVEILKEKYRSQVREVVLGATKDEGGTRSHTIKVGGETALPFLHFEGEIPNRPVVAMEIWDIVPEEWPASLKSYFEDVYNDPGAWAKKCVEQYGADLIAIRFKSADPDIKDASADECIATLKKVLEAVGVPLIVYGCGKAEKDNAIIGPLAEAAAGENLLLGVAEQDNYKAVASAAMAHKHSIIAQSPIDINIAKQLNILIAEMSTPLLDRIIIDPTVAALGYGLEYSYSIMERARFGALQGDRMLAMPTIANVGHEVWSKKEANISVEEQPGWGEQAERSLTWEATTASALLQAGMDILVMRHPEAVQLIKKQIDELMQDNS